MIVVDIETSGAIIYPDRGIWQIAAMELENPNNTFFEEARIDDTDQVEQGALIVTGKTEEELRTNNKQSQKQMLINLFNWASKIKNRNMICHNPQFDYTFIYIKAKKYGLENQFPFPYKCFDLHTLASIKYLEIKKEMAIDKIKNVSSMNSTKIFEFCGLKDNRIRMDSINKAKIAHEGNPHNAMEDVNLTAEAFSRLFFGKPLLQIFKDSPLPEYLKKN